MVPDDRTPKKIVVAISAILIILLMALVPTQKELRGAVARSAPSVSPTPAAAEADWGGGVAPMFSFLVAGLLTLLLGFIIGWLAAWINLLRTPGTTPGPLWKWVLIGAAAGVLLLFLLMLSPWVDLSFATEPRLAARPTETAQAAPPAATYTPYPTHTPAPTYTPQPTFTALPTSTPTNTPTVTPRPTHTPTLTATPTESPTSTPAKPPTATPTGTPAATVADKTVNHLPTTGIDPDKTIRVALIVVLVALLLGAGIWETRRQAR